MTGHRRVVGPALALTCAVALVGCSGEEESGTEADPAAPVEVTVGKAFRWNDFAIDDGWKVEGVERGIGIEEKVITPEVSGTLTNDSAEERAAIFQMVFTQEGDPVATVNCSAATMVEDQSMPFLCPGINTTMPDDYDAITVMTFDRGTGDSSNDDSGT